MRFRPASSGSLRVELNMTPMIDVVFQLLAFFIVSFRIVQQEGDLAIKLPLEAEGTTTTDFTLPLAVQLVAGADGALAAIELDDQRLADTAALRAHVVRLVAAAPPETSALRVDLLCDESLRYEHAMAALTAVSGIRAGEDVTPLVEEVRLRTRN